MLLAPCVQRLSYVVLYGPLDIQNLNTVFYQLLGGQSSTWLQGLYRCCYVKPINAEKTNRNNSGGSVGKSYSHVHEG